jgi:hypothetical protein
MIITEVHGVCLNRLQVIISPNSRMSAALDIIGLLMNIAGAMLLFRYDLQRLDPRYFWLLL